MLDPTLSQSDGPDMSRFAFEQDRPPRHWLYVIVLICAFLACALIWSAIAQVDELSRAEGKVVPSSKIQIVKSAETGVVDEILVRVGEHVRAGQLLIRLDDTTTTSSEGEVEARVRALQAQVARLRVEYESDENAAYICPEALLEVAQEICVNEASLLQVRRMTLAQNKLVLNQRVEQRQRELNEAHTNGTRLENALLLSQEKLDLLQPLAKRQLVSKTEMIDAQRALSDIRGERDAVIESIARLEAALSEAQLQVQQVALQFRQEALTDLTMRLAELSSASQTLRGASDRVARTDIRSPVDGIVNEMSVNTIGSFVAPGDRLVDIVPVGDTLVIEAKLKPSDVAFVLPGQPADIKFTAYDFSVFGGLDGEVQNVSADSIIDPNTREAYYIVLIKTGDAVLHFNDKELPILPGMITTVEIKTGKKTILQYLLKPINKARQEALRER